jgi:hypothetical protein
VKRTTHGFGAWTTSLDSSSRLGLTAFWRRRMDAIAALPLAPRAVARRALGGATLAAALLASAPLVEFAPVAAAQEGESPTDAAHSGQGQPRNENFVVRFTNGVELELIGVSASPSNADSWRAPDGTPIPAPYKSLRPPDNMWNSPMLREICWRWRGADDPEIQTSWQILEEHNGQGPIWPGGPDGNALKDIDGHVVPFTLIEPTCTLRFTMSYPGSKWQTYWQGQGGHVFSYGRSDGTGVTIDKPRVMDGGAFVVMAFKFPDDIDARLTAIDHDGEHHVGKWEFAGSVMGVRQLAVQFPELDPRNIKTWIVQQRTRFTESAEFRNVSLDPETETIVQIVGRTAEAGADGAAAEPKSYGPEVNAVIHVDGSTHESEFVDFDQGKVFKRDDRVPDEDVGAWLKNQSVDASARLDSDVFVGLFGYEMIAIPTEAENWDNIDELREHLRGAKPSTPVILDAGGPLPATFFFQTREGARGVVQIVEVVPQKAIKFRYKLAT